MDFVALFRDVAFPIAITAYLLRDTTRRLEAQQNSMLRIELLLALMAHELGIDLGVVRTMGLHAPEYMRPTGGNQP